MGHGEEPPFKVPHYSVYSNYLQFPQLAEHETRLKRIGLKDPWVRNYVHVFDKNHPHVIGFLPHLRGVVMCGWKLGAVIATTIIAIEEGYSFVKHVSNDTTSGGIFDKIISILSKPFTSNSNPPIKKHDGEPPRPILQWLSQHFDAFVDSLKGKETTGLDTGGSSFDRLIISENKSPISFIDKSIFNTFRRRGIEWSNGNIRLVNTDGRNILGSDVTVQDRSVSIPLRLWLKNLHLLFNT